jgi:outer membrane immunogenic protein
MRRQFLLASVGAIAIIGPAFAAEPTPPPPPPPPPPIFSWTGLYAGVQVGYAWDHDSVSAFFPGPILSPFPVFGVVSFSDSPQGVIGGAHIGYNLQWNQWVLGVEGTVDGTSVSKNVFDPFNFVTDNLVSTVQGSIRVRAGIAFDRVLLYGTGGAAFAGIENTYSTGLPIFVPGFFGTERISRTRSGWTAGGGLEYAVTNNWSIRAEYRYSDFGHFVDYPFTVLLSPFGTLTFQHHLTENQVQFGISYKFESMAPVPVVAKY